MAKFKVEVQGTGLGDFEVEAHSFKDNQNGEFIDFLDFEEPRTPSHHEDMQWCAPGASRARELGEEDRKAT